MHSYEKDGILKEKDITLPNNKQLKKGVAIVECVQHIPCNPCVDICPVDAIGMKDINAPPVVDFDKCIGCGRCVAICPGLAIFVLKTIDDKKALITLPYEFTPIPNKEDIVKILDREGKIIGEGIVKKVVKSKKTCVITVEIDRKFIFNARNIKI